MGRWHYEFFDAQPELITLSVNMQSFVQVISRASGISPWRFLDFSCFLPSHPSGGTRAVRTDSDSGPGWVCPDSAGRRSSCNLPGASLLRRRSRWYGLAAGLWLHSAASPPRCFIATGADTGPFLSHLQQSPGSSSPAPPSRHYCRATRHVKGVTLPARRWCGCHAASTDCVSARGVLA